ncbi:hypothetical protein [Shewanella baltica]|uniref:hypothetical protein n=1 Tax=Shewanella baltica TaxID=62322 RepID=UPI00217EE581|nr:hypothetical protein [Shewanella baltica]MCS6192603.1 hypothetical protein [Shewanella baltica]
MEVDFFKDLETEIKEKLKGFGYQIPSFEELSKQHISATEAHLSYKHYDIKNLILHFLTVTERRIPIKKWNIHISPRLQNRPETANMVSMLSHGVDVNPFLSKQVKARHQNKDNKTDLLRFEWGIHHIHFEEGGKGDDMLFVYFDGDDAYLLDILLHEKKEVGNVTWTNTSLIQILHDYWPQAISRAILQTGSKEILTQEERRILRKKAGNTTVTVEDGTEYLPLGGSFTSSKHPARAIIGTDRLVDRVRVLEHWVLHNEQVIRQALDLHNRDIDIKLVLDENYMPRVFEVTKRALLNLIPNDEKTIA